MQTAFLDRRQAAALLNQSGFPTAPATLAKLASIGGGPAFVHFGRKPLYRREDLQAWATQRCTLRTSTSDPGVPLESGPSIAELAVEVQVR
jgi:hypothetical protein